MVVDIRKYLRKKSSSCNHKSFTSILNSLSVSFQSIYFLYFPTFLLSWHMYSILLINNLILSRSWPKYVDPNLMFIFSICPLLFYNEWWRIYFTMKLREFVVSFSTFSFIDKFCHEKSCFMQKKLTNVKPA